MVNDFFEKVLAEFDLALPQRGLVGLALVPPELGTTGDHRTHAGIPSLILVDQRDGAAKEPPHLVAEPRPSASAAPAAGVQIQFTHELRERGPQDEFTALGAYRFGAYPGQQEAGKIAKREFVEPSCTHDQSIGAISAYILFPVAGISAGQAAQRQQPCHEAQIGVRFTGPNKLVHLVGLGEVVPRLGRGFAERLHRPAAPSEGFPNRNQPVSLTRHVLHSLMPVRLAHLKPFLPGLEPLLEDAEVSEIMINGPGNVWIEARGRLTAHAAPRLDESALLRAAIHIARPLGLDPATTPTIDARLDDGSRVAICVPPASPYVAITIRRFGKRTFSAADLVGQKALPENVLEAAERMLMTRRNILVSGGTGSGKTTLLNALIELLPVDERIVAIEDTLELRIDHSNCVRFEARGLQEGAVTIRDLVRHALQHRPDHIVVGEVRGGEAADLLQALNTGHGGSLTTVHANNAESALSRIASCAMQGGGELPWEVTCRGVVDGRPPVAMVIHMTRREGRRFVEEAAFVKGYDAKENQWDIERLERISLAS